jgi:tRNA-dependent cyclodipeptide synthase
MPSEQYYCLVSIESSHFTPGLVEAYRVWARQRAMLSFVLLEGPERHNVAVFEGVSEVRALTLCRERGNQLAAFLRLSDLELLHWDDFRLLIPYTRVFRQVTRAFREDSSFRRHCLSQTFSNLQPKFRRLGVRNNRDPLVKRATEYLLEEVAAKLAAVESGAFTGEILPGPEMGLMARVYSGRYFARIPELSDFRIVVHDGHNAVEGNLIGGAPQAPME